MDYAYDAAKILRDWPEEVKHLYSLLPKRISTNFTKGSTPNLPKKEITQNTHRLEAPVVEEKQILPVLPEPIKPTISHNEQELDKPLIEKKPPMEEFVPAPRRRRVAGSTSSVKKKSRVGESDVKIRRRSRGTVVVPENVHNEPSKLSEDKPVVQTVLTTNSPSSSVCEVIENNPFTSLNDDCLISIFSFCDKLDLVSLSLVCERFQFIVSNYLKAKISKIVDLSKIKSCDKLTICEATKFLKFIDAAQNMQQLELTMSAFHENKDQLILGEILKCCGPNLNCIKFNGFSFIESFTTEWKHIFRGLDSVVFDKCILSNNYFKTLLKFCENLEVLNVIGSNAAGSNFNDDIKHECSEFKCNKLKEFRLISSRHCGTSSELVWLLENNPNLKVLQMSDVGDSIKLTGEILQRIGQFGQMQELEFSFKNFVSNLVNNLHHLVRLKELRSLSLQCDWMNISTFVKELSSASKQIESLSFECIDIDVSFMKTIGRFRKLKYLKLENTVVNEPSQEVFEHSLMDLTYRLNNLTHFHSQLHLFTEDSLVQFVERMRKLEHLQISGLVMNLILVMRFVSVCLRRVNGLKLNLVVDNYQYINDYLDLVS